MKKIAIVGSGISGMGAAYYLKDHFDLTVFEKENRPGGHTNTITVDEDGRPVPVDTGFIVFNHVTYPNLLRLFDDLGIEQHAASMGFSVWNRRNGLQYCGSGISGLFAQRRNLLKPWYYRFLLEVNRFNREAPADLHSGFLVEKAFTMREYLDTKGFDEVFRENYILPMSSAIWSTPMDKMLEFPAATLIRFFENHGLLGLNTHHQWYSIRGGSHTYLNRIRAHLKNALHTGEEVRSVRRLGPDSVEVITPRQTYHFHAVILASHAPDTLQMLVDASPFEREILSKFPYHPNKAVLHTDASVMPPLKRIWSAWNYKIDDSGQSTVYHMNQLQDLPADRDYFVSINEIDRIREDKVICEIQYEHPLFNMDSIRAQADFQKLNETGPVYFAGAYSRYGFHEDGLISALKVVERLVEKPAARPVETAGRWS
jgi:predicted NAD/FAD-binding protein